MAKPFKESDWQTGSRIESMLKLVLHRAGDRKLRLFGCACCRRIWNHLPSDRHRNLVEVSEFFADGAATVNDLRGAASAPDGGLSYAVGRDRRIYESAARAAHLTGHGQSAAAVLEVLQWTSPELVRAERRAQAELMREIFGNPFRPPALDPRWLTSSVIDVAAMIYAERAFERLPILSDALMDAGCDEPDVLGHCRSLGPHVRGCWVVDLILGK
jgi:hypothetical protein